MKEKRTNERTKDCGRMPTTRLQRVRRRRVARRAAEAVPRGDGRAEEEVVRRVDDQVAPRALLERRVREDADRADGREHAPVGRRVVDAQLVRELGWMRRVRSRPVGGVTLRRSVTRETLVVDVRRPRAGAVEPRADRPRAVSRPKRAGSNQTQT